MRYRNHLTLCTLLVASIGTTAFGQAVTEQRDRRPIVQVTGIGEGDPVVLRWRPTPGQKSTVQISTRTVPNALERPDIEDIDPEVILTAFTRPPIEKLWTIEGRVERKSEPDATADRIRWRILDAVARLVGIKETRAAPEAPEEDEPSDAGPTASSKEDSDSRLASKVASPTESDPDAVALAIELEGVINGGLVGTKGAAITQTIGGTGIAPAATTIRLENASRRAQFECDVLRNALEMIEIQLPTEPIGIGGSWTSRWTRRVNDVPVEIVLKATLLAVNEEATAGTRVASEATIQVEYERRTIDPNAEPRLKRISEADGRGRLQLDLEAPLRLDARLVETPPGPPKRGITRLVTRIRADTIK